MINYIEIQISNLVKKGTNIVYLAISVQIQNTS